MVFLKACPIWRGAVALLILVVMYGTVSAQPLEWSVFNRLNRGRHLFEAIYLGNGKVLVAGGYVGSTGIMEGSVTKGCEVIDLTAGTVTEGPLMSDARAEFVLLQSPTAEIYAVGGYTGSGSTRSVERFDAATNSWVWVGNLVTERRQHVAYFISPNEILVTGGFPNIATTEIFNVVTGQSKRVSPSPFGGNTARALKLRTKTVIVGGRQGGPGSQRQGIMISYNARADEWLQSDAPEPVAAPTVLTLPGGEGVITCGAFDEAPFRTSRRMSVLNGEGEVTNTVFLETGRQHHAVATLPDGRIIVGGGLTDGVGYASSTEIVNLATGVVRPGPDHQERSAYLRYVQVPDGVKMPNGESVTIVAISGLSRNTNSRVIEVLSAPCSDNAPATDIALKTVHLAGRAAMVDDSLELTQSTIFRVGAAWVERTGAVATSFSYDVTAHFQNGNDGGEPEGSLAGADGLCLVIQASGPDVTGNSGRGIGYNGLQRAIAIEVDTYMNSECNDPDGNHLAVQSNGTGTLHSAHNAPEVLGITSDIPVIVPDGRPYYLRYAYTGNRLDVYLSQSSSLEAPVLTIDNLDIASLLKITPSDRVWVGLTASTGQSRERHVVSRWSESTCNGTITSVLDGSTAEHGRVATNEAPLVALRSHPAGQAELDLGGHQGEDGRVIVADASGAIHTVLRFDGSAHSLALSSNDLAAGMYYVVVQSSRGSSTVAWSVVR